MPSSRRLRITGLVAVLTVLIIFYITNGAKSTYNSQFYTRTVEALKNRQDAQARQEVIEKEKSQLERVERLQKEHDVAVSAAAAEETSSAAKVAGLGRAGEKQKPLAGDVKDAVEENVKPVAGRKTMKDGQKVVQTKPDSDSNDGVAKVGNVEPKASSALKSSENGPATEEDHRVETELNDILKKGPIIIFSKSYCPFSKKAKHILLDLYSITPPPYVVELDQHELGSGLQDALKKSTGRRTVPNILINGKSIGGGDDVEALHNGDELVEKVKSMGGKRIVEVKRKEVESGQGSEKKTRTEVKFKA
jgi:glutaredoxin